MEGGSDALRCWCSLCSVAHSYTSSISHRASTPTFTSSLRMPPASRG
jgi:hypothetical protein